MDETGGSRGEIEMSLKVECRPWLTTRALALGVGLQCVVR